MLGFSVGEGGVRKTRPTTLTLSITRVIFVPSHEKSLIKTSCQISDHVDHWSKNGWYPTRANSVAQWMCDIVSSETTSALFSFFLLSNQNASPQVLPLLLMCRISISHESCRWNNNLWSEIIKICRLFALIVTRDAQTATCKWQPIDQNAFVAARRHDEVVSMG